MVSASNTSITWPVIQKVPSTYTPAQVIQWLKTIDFEGVPDITEEQVASEGFPTSLDNLEKLTRLHLLAFAFENCDMHYTPEHIMHTTPAAMFRNSVIGRRGSFCFGLNTLLLEMLRGLGYRAYASAARVNDKNSVSQPRLGPLSHMVIIVQPDCEAHHKTNFLVDVGFGGAGLVRCIPIYDGAMVAGSTPSEKHRLSRECHDRTCLKEGESLWHLEISRNHKTDVTTTWQTVYAFTEAEFFPEDFIRYSFTISQMPVEGGLFWENIICVKYFEVQSEESVEPLVGKYILLGKELRKAIGSDSVVLRTFRTEEERICALRDVFCFGIPDDATENIKGRAAELGWEAV